MIVEATSMDSEVTIN